MFSDTLTPHFPGCNSVFSWEPRIPNPEPLPPIPEIAPQLSPALLVHRHRHHSHYHHHHGFHNHSCAISLLLGFSMLLQIHFTSVPCTMFHQSWKLQLSPALLVHHQHCHHFHDNHHLHYSHHSHQVLYTIVPLLVIAVIIGASCYVYQHRKHARWANENDAVMLL